MRRVIRSTGTLLLAFLLGSVATTIGTAVAFFVVPMRSLGQDGWKIAAALMGRHIGGAVNYVAISEALQVPPSVIAAGLAADNVICAVYFTTLFARASQIPAESSSSTSNVLNEDVESGNKLPVLQTAAALAASFAICKAGSYLTKYLGIQGGSLPAITGIVVILATILPKQFAYLAPSGEAMAMILMQVFFTVVGASRSIRYVLSTAPSILLFCLVQIAVRLAIILGLGKLFRFELKSLLIASNANVGGPTTACGMATAKGWSSLVVPGILAGIFGMNKACGTHKVCTIQLPHPNRGCGPQHVNDYNAPRESGGAHAPICVAFATHKFACTCRRVRHEFGIAIATFLGIAFGQAFLKFM